MNENLALKDLTEKLKQKKQRELEEIAEIEKENLKEFMQSLKVFTSKELDTIKRDINQKNQHIKRAIQEATAENIIEIKSELADLENITTNLSHWKKITIIPIIAPLIFLALIFIAFWGTLTYYKKEITQAKTELDTLKQLSGNGNLPVYMKFKDKEGFSNNYLTKVIQKEDGTFYIKLMQKEN